MSEDSNSSGCGCGCIPSIWAIGGIFAAIMAWTFTHSIFWAILAFIGSWIYLFSILIIYGIEPFYRTFA